MNLKALEYLAAIEKYGSLNKASKSLYISQPSLTNAVKALEKELGYQILMRTNKGILFTDYGKQALRIANRILQESEKLYTLQKVTDKLQFHVSSSYNPIASYALYALIRKYQEWDMFHFSILQENVYDVLDSVYQSKATLGIVIYSDQIEQELFYYTSTRMMFIMPLKHVIGYVNLREGHPLLESGFSFERLWNYPFVHYAGSVNHSYKALSDLNVINPNKIIYVNDSLTRSQLVTDTDAFSIGIPTPPREKKRLGWVSIPYPRLSYQISAVIGKDNSNPLTKEYLSLLEKELLCL